MGIILKKKKHLWTRLPIWLAILVFLTLSPLIIGLLGASISEWISDKPCHEGNCFWGVLPWYLLMTLPIGGLGIIVYLIIVVIDAIGLSKSERDRSN